MARVRNAQRAEDQYEGAPGAPDNEIPDWAETPASESELAVYKPPAKSQWRRPMSGHELVEYVRTQVSSYDMTDPAEILKLAAQVARASTVEQVLTGGQADKGRELFDVILSVDAIKFNEGRFDEGCPYYGLLSGTRTDTGEPTVVSVGGWRTVFQLAMLHYMAQELPEGSPYLVPEGSPGAIAQETYPFYFKIRQSEETARGFHVNYLAHPMS